MTRLKARPRVRLALCFLMWFQVALPGAGLGAADEKFSTWLDGVRQEALGAGISAATVDSALAELELLPEVITADRNQPEFRTSLQEYLDRRVSAARVGEGRELLHKHRRLLARIARRYQIPPHYLVALWGIETDFGRHQGKIPVIQALATLAYDGRRGEYFRGELLAALRILDAGHVAPEKMLGSWAGAMGQLQFMPSVFLRYGIDQSGDGRIDIFANEADVLGSAANYLARSGWEPGRTWGREVRLPKQIDRQLLGMDHSAKLKRWRQLGVRQVDGQALPRAALEASLIQPEGEGGRAFLVYRNYRVFRTWNRSHNFAIAVGLLADALVGR